jgi:serine/threonine-protein kinase ULK4
VDKFHKQKVINEVKILNMLHHPNILRFYNWYETSNHYWIIIDYCSGGDLMNFLAQDYSLPEETVRLFGTDIVNGLQYVITMNICV